MELTIETITPLPEEVAYREDEARHQRRQTQWESEMKKADRWLSSRHQTKCAAASNLVLSALSPLSLR